MLLLQNITSQLRSKSQVVWLGVIVLYAGLLYRVRHRINPRSHEGDPEQLGNTLQVGLSPFLFSCTPRVIPGLIILTFHSYSASGAASSDDGPKGGTTTILVQGLQTRIFSLGSRGVGTADPVREHPTAPD